MIDISNRKICGWESIREGPYLVTSSGYVPMSWDELKDFHYEYHYIFIGVKGSTGRSLPIKRDGTPYRGYISSWYKGPPSSVIPGFSEGI